MELKDLTREQVIEIAKLAFGQPDWIKSDFETKHQPYIEEWYDDAREYYSIKFEAYFIGDKTAIYRVEISPNLDVHLWYFENGKNGMINKPMVIVNQRKIQEKFTEFGF